MDYSLRELLSEVPTEIFFNDMGNPDFNGIFVEVARRIYRQPDGSFAIAAEDFLNGRLPNLTTFQRSVTAERRRREGRGSGR